MTTPQHPNLFARISDAVAEGVAAVYAWESGGKYISRYHDYPTVSTHSDGFPWFSRTYLFDDSAPIEYTSAFRHDGINADGLTSFQSVVDLVSNDPFLRHYFLLGDDDASPDSSKKKNPVGVFIKLEAMIERYVYVSGHQPFDASVFQPIYLEWESAVFSKDLDIEITVPIINQRFSIDSFEIAEGISVEALDKQLQLARMAARRSSMNDSDEASKAATHALVLRGWTLPNEPFIFGHRFVTQAGAYSAALNKANDFFAAMRVVVDCETGFGQVVVRHSGWAHDWTADLPPVSVFTVREHPDWRGSRPEASTFGEPQLAAVRAVYRSIAEARTAKMGSAAKRLNAAKLRSNESDSILDITIGLETLLTDDSRAEITYRLGMRMAALARLVPVEGYTPAQVYRACKRLYDFRSAVAHGSPSADKKRMVRVSADRAHSANAVGVTFLRHALRALSEYPTLQTPVRIDARLLGFEDSSERLDQ